jgi:hypothetical protein
MFFGRQHDDVIADIERRIAEAGLYKPNPVGPIA